jgi:predicted metal-dependent peptidase
MTKVSVNAKKTGFSFEDVCLSFIEKCRFYTVILSKVNKVPMKQIPTAAVGFNKHGKLTMYYNPEYIESLTLEKAQGLVEHECGHIVYRHLSRFPMKGTRTDDGNGIKVNALEAHENKILNWGTDCAINQYIPVLPDGGLYPETFDLPRDESADVYIEELRKKFPPQSSQSPKGKGMQQKCKTCDGTGKDPSSKGKGQDQDDCPDCDGTGKQDLQPLDSHDLWGKVVDVDENGNVSISNVEDNPDIDPEYECENIVNKAIKECRDFGGVPAHIQKEIDRLKSVKRHDWKKSLNVFINSVLTITRRMSQKRVDRRLYSIVDYLAPGKKKSRKPKVLYVRDTSGSMFSDKVQAEINAELEQLAKRCDVFVADCDTKVHQSYKFKKAKDIKPYKGGGGTSFKDAFREAKKLGVDGVIYATDTYGDFPQEKEIGKYARSTIWLTFNQNKVQIPFGRHVNINPAEYK